MRLCDFETARACATKFGQVRAEAEPFTKVFSQRAHISAGGTPHAHREIACPVLIFSQQLAVALNGFKGANRDWHGSALNFFAAPREFIKLLSFDLLRRIHRRGLINFAAQR